MNNIGQRIYDLRLKNNLSQDILAEKLGVSRQAISKWENSQSMPEIEKVVQMSEIFSVSTDYILKGTEILSSTDASFEEQSPAKGFTAQKLQQIIGLILLATGIIGILFGFVYSSREMFQLSPLFVIFGLMLIYIKRNAILWCLGTTTVLTLLFGRYLLHSFVYFILLFIEIMSIAMIVVMKMK